MPKQAALQSRRFDVNYWRLLPLVEERLASSKYPTKDIGTIVSLVQYGCSKLATVDPVGIPILRMNNLQANGWDLSDLKYVKLPQSEVDSYRLDVGDLLFNRTTSARYFASRVPGFLRPI